MVLVIGNPADPVIERVIAVLTRAGAAFARVDERFPSTYKIGRTTVGSQLQWQIRGGECVGQRTVGAIFVRHESDAPSRATLEALRTLHSQLAPLLVATVCRVMNRPACATANYSKPYQLRQMAAAGFL